jgi:KAP family P-loop domain
VIFVTAAISSETAVHDPKDDRYNRAAFAEKLATTLLKLPPESIVIGLEGPWGGGKTTVMNFVTHYASQQTKHSPPLVVRFNPWWYSSRDDLAVRFFEEMSGQIAGQLQPKDSKLAKELLATFKRFGSVLKPLSKAALGDERVEAGAEAVSALFGVTTDSSLNAMRTRLEKTLNDLERPVWVLMDDVDRLTPSESLEALSLVRGVGDLTNVRYFVAYDRLQLEERLDAALGMKRASTYLDKIVQVTIPIPPPSPNVLYDEFFEGLNQIHNAFELLVDEDAFSKLASIMIPGIINTPRDLKRLLNAYSITLGLLGGDLFAPDLMIVDILRLFAPSLHEYIVKHGKFVNSNPDPLLEQVEPINRRQSIAQLLHNLYPRLESTLHPKTMPATPLIYPKIELHMTSRRFFSEGFADAYLFRGLEKEQFTGQQSAALERALLSEDELALTAWIKSLPHGIEHRGISLIRERSQNHSIEARIAAARATLALGDDNELSARFQQSEAWLSSCASSFLLTVRHTYIHQRELLTVLQEKLEQNSWTALKAAYFSRKEFSLDTEFISLWAEGEQAVMRLLPNLDNNPARVTSAFKSILVFLNTQERDLQIKKLFQDPKKVEALIIAQHLTNARTSYSFAETVQEALAGDPNPLEAREIGLTLDILEPVAEPLMNSDDTLLRQMTERFLESMRSFNNRSK